MDVGEIVGLALALELVGALVLLVFLGRFSPSLRRLIYAALGLRVLGAGLRYAILFGYYGGAGDANRYFRWGLEYAERFGRFDFSPFYDSALWFGRNWWGTPFVPFPSGIVLTAIGPSLIGEFVIFSLLAFLGLVGFAIAFRRSTPGIPLEKYARWIWLFPSLWFWPSSVGKEALVLLGMGLAVAGFVGKRKRINWFLMSLGLFFIFAIRPQVAAVVMLSFVLGHWLSFERRWSVRKAFQGVAILVAGLGGIWLSMTYAGVDGFDIDGVQSYMEMESEDASSSGSTVDGVEVSILGVPSAMLNILVRPFVWEASNVMSLFSAVEILGFWAIAWYRRRNLLEALRTWRSHSMLRVAVPFILLYSVTLGMLVVNLGIIARQRIFLFPFLFLFLEAVPAAGRKPKPRFERAQERHRRVSVWDPAPVPRR